MGALRRRSGLWALGLVFAAVYAPTAVWLVQRWSLGVWFHVHGFVVVPLAAWLAWRRMRGWSGEPADPSRWGFLLLGVAVLLQAADVFLRFDVLSAASLLLAVPGLSLLLLGRARTQALLFPLAFLWFALPIPSVAAEPLLHALCSVSAVGTEKCLAGLGYDVAREGTLVRVGPESVRIANPCSGFSTLLALTMVALLLAYLARTRWPRALLLLLLALPLAVGANILRCVALGMLVAAFGQGVLETYAHEGSGLLAFALALGLLLAAEGRVLGRSAEVPA
jgi:exosortase